MDTEEIIDVFDDDGTHAGTATRLDAHRLGLWHKSFHCWIVRKRDGVDYVLLQQRAASKKYFPQMFDISSAGHYSAGEGKLDGVRELEEELGLRVEANRLFEIMEKREVFELSDSYTNREICHVFLLNDDTSIAGYTLDKSEVMGLCEARLDEIIALFRGEVGEITVDNVGADGKRSKMSITAASIVPAPPSDYIKVFEAAVDYLNRVLE